MNEEKDTRGRKPKNDLPLLIVADPDLFNGTAWSPAKHDRTMDWKDFSVASGSVLSKAPEHRGIIIQVDTRHGNPGHGLWVGARIRRDEHGTAPILFVAKEAGAFEGKHSHLVNYGKLLSNRGSTHLVLGKDFSRKQAIKILDAIPQLDPAARWDIVLNQIDIRGRLEELVDHGLIDPEPAVRETARGELARLALAIGKGEEVLSLMDRVEAMRKDSVVNGSRSSEQIRRFVSELQELFAIATNTEAPDLDKDMLKGCRILLVEDDKTFADWLVTQLEGLSAEVEPVVRGNEAERILKQSHSYDVLIADWRLYEPGTTRPQVERQGFELFQFCGERIQCRISLTSKDERTVNTLRSFLPDVKVYKKDMLYDRYVWGLLLQDLQAANRWSEANIKRVMKRMGVGGDWIRWKEYLQAQHDKKVWSGIMEAVKGKADIWWKEIAQDVMPVVQGSSAQNRNLFTTMIMKPAHTYDGHYANRRPDDLVEMLVVRRIIFAFFSACCETWLAFNPDPASKQNKYVRFAEGFIMHKFKHLKGAAAKNFLNTQNGIQLTRFNEDPCGLFKEEIEWLRSHTLDPSFAVKNQNG